MLIFVIEIYAMVLELSLSVSVKPRHWLGDSGQIVLFFMTNINIKNLMLEWISYVKACDNEFSL